jgi:nitrogen fixation/metabolism regulation signal transduction histidine kinase
MKRATRWAWIVALVAATGAGLVLAFLLALATNNRVLYERHYEWLFWLNVSVAGALALVVGIAAVRLFLRVRSGKFGSRLLFKLAGIFALVGVLPGLVIYTVSYQFVARSIESWFDVRVEGALEAGLNLGRGTLEAASNDLARRTRSAAERLGEAGVAPSTLALLRLREQLTAEEIAVLGANGQVLVQVGGGAVVAAERPPPALLRQARLDRVVARLEGLDDETQAASGAAAAAAATPAPAPAVRARARAIAVIPTSDLTLGSSDRFLMVTQALPAALTANALAVQSAYREYQQRALARDGLRRMYIGTLTLVLVLAVFGAVALAIVLGNQLARPLLLLAEGVRQVARGDLTRKAVFASRDELGGLTRAFADMTDQLSEARGVAERSLAQLERARTRLQTILDNLSAGVIVFDRDGRIEMVNPGATRILRLPLSAYVGRPLADVPGLEAFAQAVGQRFDLHRSSPEAGERDQWQDAFDLQTAPERDSLALLVRGAALPQRARLMVFDDITEVVSAQRSAAWSEVARRLAHEIKNPLTPIQLSAERLQHKLEPKLEGADQSMLVRSVATIVAQVQAMKQLVNEFRDYARLPAAKLAPLDLNALVGEVLALYAGSQDSGHLVADCEPGLPAILGDATQLRQVIHNLVQNGLDAVADRAEDGRVRIATEVARNEQGEPRLVRLKVIDNGHGFPDKVLKRAFEPYVTTKTKGTGLGLAVVKKIADEHGARVRLANLGEGAGDGGAQVSLSFSKLAPAESDPTAASRADERAH